MRSGFGRLGLGFGFLLLSAGVAGAQDLPRFRLPQQPDFSNVAVELRQTDRERRPRLRTEPPDTTRADRAALAGASVESRLRGLGVRDGSSFGGKGRLYLFAADGQTAVGYNLTRGQDGGWDRQGLSMDDGAFMGEAQAGIAWRQGAVQTSFGYVQRTMERENRLGRNLDEGIVALHLSFIPGR